MNKRILFTVFILMSVMTCWWLRSFFLPENLSQRIVNGNASEYVLSYAKYLKLPAYYIYQRKGQAVGSNAWLQATRELANTKANYAVELAQYFLQQDDKHQGELWLAHAMTLKNEQAIWILANLRVKEENYQAAVTLLSKLIDDHASAAWSEKSLRLLIDIALIQGDLTRLAKYTAKLKMIEPEHPLLNELFHYSVSAVKPDEQKLKETCVASVQMYATELSHLRRVSQFITQFNETSLNPYVCFTQPRYISLAQLGCWHQRSDTIRCDEGHWQQLAATIDTRYIGVMLPQGGANVNHGILYVDSSDSFTVFTHEIEHLLGFIDEYPLPKNHAKCAAVQTSPFAFNIAVLPKRLSGNRQAIRKRIIEQLAWGKMIKAQTPILTESNGQWLLGTPEEYNNEIGLFNSDTCLNNQLAQKNQPNAIQAFKPLASLTSMAYHELSFPDTYSRLLAATPRQFLMPDFQRNIAIAQSTGR
ncbi:hypothetical protein tinsulaeT_04930 [Thalassotalea insulae]|uniref:Tetratricopeptide repeat protein n=1 Tax=Thalassotalea insulae TaxID=2056778 RepID=A0ABQ6GMC9_9GAMM|nr:hypothetical protein [Thalassotalea insulae]GLX77153.1 hypothetical protein tinsulaeT_04930 [Thalassotalea insulae]